MHLPKTAHSSSRPQFFARPLPRNAVKQILKDVGSKFVPQDINIEELAGALGESAYMHSIWSQLASGKRISRQRRSLRKVIRKAEFLCDYLKRGPDRYWLQYFHNVAEIADGIARLLNIARRELRGLRTKPKSRLEISPFEWLAGEHLPMIYAKFIQRNPGRSRDFESQVAGGPYVRFVLSTCDALGLNGRKGLPHSAESVVRALTLKKSGKGRRRGH
jgi:hypothetical protein